MIGTTINLAHPASHTPATAVVIGYIYQNGRNAGLSLEFDDGERKLTYQQIRELQNNQKGDNQ